MQLSQYCSQGMYLRVSIHSVTAKNNIKNLPSESISVLADCSNSDPV